MPDHKHDSDERENQDRKGKGKGKGKPKGIHAGPPPKRRARPKGISKSVPQWGRPDRPSGSQGNRPAPICFRCGKKGHLSANCTNPPNAKRAKATDAADVIIDMTPWADEFAEWRKNQSITEKPEETEDVNGLEEPRAVQ